MNHIIQTDKDAFKNIMNAAEGVEPEPEETPQPPTDVKRSDMARTEKMEYIKEHGYDAFMALKS